VNLLEEKTEDVLRTRATSDVLFQLIIGRRSPIEISRAIGDTSPAVIKQLWRLRKAGIVRLGEKTGKFQNYEVDWERLVKESVGGMSSAGTAIVLANRNNDVERCNLYEAAMRKLSTNEDFLSLFKFFMEEEAKTRTKETDLRITETFRDAVDDFEKSLPYLCPTLKKEATNRKAIKLLKLIKILCGAVEEANRFEQIPLKNALEKMGFL
jgi:hypothetical protein